MPPLRKASGRHSGKKMGFKQMRYWEKEARKNVRKARVKETETRAQARQSDDRIAARDRERLAFDAHRRWASCEPRREIGHLLDVDVGDRLLPSGGGAEAVDRAGHRGGEGGVGLLWRACDRPPTARASPSFWGKKTRADRSPCFSKRIRVFFNTNPFFRSSVRNFFKLREF